MTGKRRASDTVEGEETVPYWDTTPIRMRRWLLALPEYLENQNEDYVSWWEQGYSMSRHTTLAPSVRHAQALRDNAVPVREFTNTWVTADLFDQSAAPTRVRALSEADMKLYQHSPHAMASSIARSPRRS